jgi:UDP-glucose 4-epimerase
LTVYDDGAQVRCFGHVRDIVRGVLDLMACPSAIGKVFNLGSDQPITIKELAERVVKLVNPGLTIENVPYSEAYAPSFEDIRARIPDLARIRATINFRPQWGLDDILREILGWKKSQ